MGTAASPARLSRMVGRKSWNPCGLTGCRELRPFSCFVQVCMPWYLCRPLTERMYSTGLRTFATDLTNRSAGLVIRVHRNRGRRLFLAVSLYPILRIALTFASAFGPDALGPSHLLLTNEGCLFSEVCSLFCHAREQTVYASPASEAF